MEETRGSWLTVSMGMFLSWSILTFLVRTWAKLSTKTWGLDDYCLSLSLAAVVAHVACNYRAVYLGYGRSLGSISSEDIPSLEKLLYFTDLIYILALGLCRASAAFFIGHMAYSGPQTIPARILVASSAAWAVASMFAIAIHGDLTRPWATIDGTQSLFVRWMAIEVVGMMIELAIWLLSAHLVCSLQMPMQRRIYILGAFGVRPFLVIFVAFRLAYLSPQHNSDPTLTSIVPSIFTQAVLHFSIIASCVTTLKSFLRHFDPTYDLERAGDIRGTATTSKRSRTSVSLSRDPYYHLEAFNQRDRRRSDPNDNVSWRPYQGPIPIDRYATAYHESTGAEPRKPGKEGRLASIARALRSSFRRGNRCAQEMMTRSNQVDSASTRTDASEGITVKWTTEVSVQHQEPPPENAGKRHEKA